MAALLRLAFLALTAHGAFVHAQAYLGQRSFERDASDPAALAHLRAASAWGGFPQPGVERSLALAAAGQGDSEAARAAFARYLASRPFDVAMRVRFADLLARSGQGEASERELRAALIPDARMASAEDRPWRATAYSMLAQKRAAAGDTLAAAALLAKAMDDHPADASHACNLAFLRLRQGRYAEARDILTEARKRAGPQPCLETLSGMAAPH
jgi:Flp pilus assembly protein TadD